MRRLLYGVVIALLIMTVGFVISGSLQVSSNALADFPDIEHVPIYPGASISKTISDPRAPRFIEYHVQENANKVTAFYQNALAEKNWLLGTSAGGYNRYSWTDPAGKLPWHLDLTMTAEAWDASNTIVTLEYYRYPDMEEGLPAYPDARQVQVTHSDGTLSVGKVNYPARMTDKTFLTDASLQQIVDFYNSALPEAGWLFIDPSSGALVQKQAGDISSQDGLYFRSNRFGQNLQSTVNDLLSITATGQKDGSIFVTLHIAETELTAGW